MELRGKKILVVEDSPLIAATTEELLLELGGEVVGPAGNMADAHTLCETADFDIALVDLNIRGAKAFPLLKIMERRGIPFVLTTGYADWRMPEEWAQIPRLPKPYTMEAIGSSLSKALQNGSISNRS